MDITPASVIVRRAGAALAVALAAGTSASAQDAGTSGRVVGRVVDQTTGEGLPSATLEVVGTDVRGPASPDGRFMLPPMEPDRITLTVRHAGYLPRSEEVDVVEGATVTLRITLAPSDRYDLDPLLVTVRSRILERRGFYERRGQGYSGVFLTRQDIRERAAQNVTELFEGIPGLRVLGADLDGPRIVFQRAVSLRDSGVCAPALFLDGVKSQIAVYDAILDPTHVEGVEIYRGATVPGQYNDPCGAILFWTRGR